MPRTGWGHDHCNSKSALASVLAYLDTHLKLRVYEPEAQCPQRNRQMPQVATLQRHHRRSCFDSSIGQTMLKTFLTVNIPYNPLYYTAYILHPTTTLQVAQRARIPQPHNKGLAGLGKVLTPAASTPVKSDHSAISTQPFDRQNESYLRSKAGFCGACDCLALYSFFFTLVARFKLSQTELIGASWLGTGVCVLLVGLFLTDAMGLFKSHKQITVAVGPAQPGETAPRRNAGAKDAEWKAPNNMDMSTVYDLFKWAVAKHAAHQAMGSRTTIKVHTEEKELTKKVNGTDTKVKKTWQFYELTPYKYITYKELDTLVHDLASGIRELGVKPNGEERFHVYSQTSAHWLQTMLACNSQGIPIVTAYDTLGEEGLTHSMVQTKTVAVLVDNDNLHTLVRPLEKATDIRLVVYRHKIDNPDDHPDVKAIRAVRDSIKLISFDDVVALGKANKHQPSPPKADDVCTIMYTSGSTGPPKGVVLLNSTVLAGVAGATGNITTAIISPGDRILAFLPLAHIFELVVELSSLYWGSTLGYGHPKTIVEANMRNCGTDIKELRPTIMVGVPAVWESVRKGVIMKVKQNPPIAQKIFWAAYHSKLALSHWGLGLPLVDSLIFKKVKDATGGRLRYVLNGGAPLSVDTQTFISNLLCPCLLGYGLTETTANTCLMTPANFAIGNLGELTHAITVKLVDVPDAGYFARDNKGEVFIKGPAVSPLYFDNEKETKDAYTDDGWFRTGDIGEWMPNGALKLIDRRKNLVKTLNGEYIALEKLESIYRSNSYVSNICVCADQNRVKPVAIVFPLEKALQELMKEIGTEDETDPKLAAAVTKSLIATGTEGGLKGVELICGTALTETEWTPQNGFLTSAQKLQRKKILADNKDAVEAIYKNNQ